MYVKVQNGAVLRHPYSATDLIRDTPGTSFPSGPLPDDLLAEWGVLPVVPTAPPAHNAATHKVVELTPVLTNGVWTQQWSIESLTAEEQQAAMLRVKEEVIFNTQRRLDDFAKTRNYDGILSACTYATSSVPRFQAEGQYCVDARDNTWSTLYTIMAEVEAGTRPMPSGFADIEPDLPGLTWPTI